MTTRSLSLFSSTVLLQCLAAANGKVETGSIYMSGTEAEPNWQYIGKFGYGFGVGTYRVRARLREVSSRPSWPERPAPPPANASETMSVQLELYLDEHWPDAQGARPCSSEQKKHLKRTKPVAVGKEWGPWRKGGLEQIVRPHVWYFALSKCDQTRSRLVIDYELWMQQNDGSQLSQEHRHMLGATLLAVVCLTLFLGRFGARCCRLRQCAGEVHPVILTLAGSALLQWAAQLFHIAHLQLHEAAGESESSAETLADVLFMLSQVASSTLLVVIARGYTLMSCKDSELTAVRPTAAAIALLHVALVGHGKLQGEHAGKHHENGGAAGWALVAVRLLLCGWFLACAQELIRQQSRGSELRGFLGEFRIAGCLYFLSYPALYIVAQVLAPYWQHPVMHVGLVAMQAASSLWLSELFLSRSSKYNQVSTLNAAMLPQPTTTGHAAGEGSPAYGSPASFAAHGSPASQGAAYGSPVSAAWGQYHEKTS